MNHQWTKEVVFPIDSEKGLFILFEFMLVSSANELRLDLFPLLAISHIMLKAIGKQTL